MPRLTRGNSGSDSSMVTGMTIRNCESTYRLTIAWKRRVRRGMSSSPGTTSTQSLATASASALAPGRSWRHPLYHHSFSAAARSGVRSHQTFSAIAGFGLRCYTTSWPLAMVSASTWDLVTRYGTRSHLLNGLGLRLVLLHHLTVAGHGIGIGFGTQPTAEAPATTTTPFRR